MTTRSPSEMMEEIQMQLNLARHTIEQMSVMVAAYRDTLPAPHAEGPKPRRKGGIKSLDTWIGWLTKNGPAYRKTIADATGVNLATNATPHVRKWKEHMEMWDDNQLPSDALLNITAPSAGMGRPPVIYFLWSQRYELLGKFGVGPLPEPKAMTGVIQPPSAFPIDPEFGEERPFNWTTGPPEDWPTADGAWVTGPKEPTDD